MTMTGGGGRGVGGTEEGETFMIFFERKFKKEN
jgi:hypothetical protein